MLVITRENIEGIEYICSFVHDSKIGLGDYSYDHGEKAFYMTCCRGGSDFCQKLKVTGVELCTIEAEDDDVINSIYEVYYIASSSSLAIQCDVIDIKLKLLGDFVIEFDEDPAWLKRIVESENKKHSFFYKILNLVFRVKRFKAKSISYYLK